MLIRKAEKKDLSRIAEIYVFNNRLFYLPIFQEPAYSYGVMQVVSLIDDYFGKPGVLDGVYVAEIEGMIAGFVEIGNGEIMKLHVDPYFQNKGCGAELIEFAKAEAGAEMLWALDKNEGARRFYNRHGFWENGDREFVPGTKEYIVRYVRK